MVRHRILAALLALPLAACAVEDPASAEPTAVPAAASTSDVKAALGLIPGAQVVGAHADGVPFMVRGEFGTTGQSLRGLGPTDAHARLGEALGLIAPLFRLEPTQLVVTHTQVDERGHTHVRYAQVKQGLPVVGHELIVHVDESGRVYAANGSARDGEMVSSKAMFPEAAAQRAALGLTQGTQLAAESIRRVYFRTEDDGLLKLAYEVVVTGQGAELPLRDHVFVSAQDGALLGRTTDIHTALNRAVYTANNKTTLPGTLKRSETGAATGDSHIDDNHGHLGTTYNCYKENFGRDSYDNAGAQLKSSVHYSTSYTNAFWNGTQMVYGDSDGVDAGPLGKSLDVTVHELTHAVTERTSNLTYANESGALNEGMSDIFAAYCESWTKGWSTEAPIWMIGDDIWTPATPGDALRYMGNPTQDGSSKDYYPERYTGSSDNGGVHWNSGIANLAFKLLSTGGKHPRGKTTVDVPALGVKTAGAIFYKANSQYMTASTTFAQAKAYTAQSATDLGQDAAAVTAAWEAVGVGGTVTPPPSCSNPIVLTNGVAVTGISVDASSWSCTYTLSVPAGATALSFDMSGGTGDADMYVKFGSAPTESVYDCRPFKGGNTESCPITTVSAGTYYVKLKGYSAASGISLKGAYTAGSTGGNNDTLVNGVESASYKGASGSWTCNTLTVPSGKSSLVFTQTGKSGTTGDADLYVQRGTKPTTSSYACRPYKSGSTESCTISSPAAGTWYACSYAYSAFTLVTMKGAY